MLQIKINNGFTINYQEKKAIIMQKSSNVWKMDMDLLMKL